MFKNIPSLNTSLSLLVLLVIGVLVFFSSIFIALAILSMAIVPLTWLWGLVTGQTYDRVCDNSELVYKLNKFGKISLSVGIGLLSIYFILKMI
jgi:hypothetical protein